MFSYPPQRYLNFFYFFFFLGGEKKQFQIVSLTCKSPMLLFYMDFVLFLESFYKKLWLCLLLLRSFISGNGLVLSHIFKSVGPTLIAVWWCLTDVFNELHQISMLIPAEDFIWWSGQVGSQVRIGPSSCIPVALSFLLNWRNCFGCFSFMNVSELVYFCSCIFVITQYLFSVVSHYGFFPCCIYILKDMSYLVVQPHNNVQWLIQMNCIFFPEQLSYAILLPKMFCVYWVFQCSWTVSMEIRLCVLFMCSFTLSHTGYYICD